MAKAYSSDLRERIIKSYESRVPKEYIYQYFHDMYGHSEQMNKEI